MKHFQFYHTKPFFSGDGRYILTRRKQHGVVSIKLQMTKRMHLLEENKQNLIKTFLCE